MRRLAPTELTQEENVTIEMLSEVSCNVRKDNAFNHLESLSLQNRFAGFTEAERRKAIKQVLLLPKYWEKADNWLSEDFGTSPRTIANYRKEQTELLLDPSNPLQLPEEHRLELETLILMNRRQAKSGRWIRVFNRSLNIKVQDRPLCERATLPLDSKQEYYVYFVKEGDDNSYLKVGIASDPDRRIKELQTGNPRKLSLLGVIPCESKEEARHIEKELLMRVEKEKRLEGEWFEATDGVLSQIKRLPRSKVNQNLNKNNYEIVGVLIDFMRRRFLSDAMIMLQKAKETFESDPCRDLDASLLREILNLQRKAMEGPLLELPEFSLDDYEVAASLHRRFSYEALAEYEAEINSTEVKNG